MIRTEPVEEMDVTVTDDGWRFALEHRSRILSHWEELAAANPTLWNGEILICTGAHVERAKFVARLVHCDYASFVAWRDWGRPDPDAWNCFGVPAAFSADGALVMGVMGHWTLNAGKVYPPSGTLEPRDVGPDGKADLIGSMRTELLEETGLDLDAARAGEMVAIFDGPRIALARRYDFPTSFAEIELRFRVHQANEEQPELAAIEAIRQTSQIDSRMPPYAQEMARYFLR